MQALEFKMPLNNSRITSHGQAIVTRKMFSMILLSPFKQISVPENFDTWHGRFLHSRFQVTVEYITAPASHGRKPQGFPCISLAHVMRTDGVEIISTHFHLH
jgi:hypothetical protein